MDVRLDKTIDSDQPLTHESRNCRKRGHHGQIFKNFGNFSLIIRQEGGFPRHHHTFTRRERVAEWYSRGLDYSEISDDFCRDFDIAFRQFGHTSCATQMRGVVLGIVLSRSSMQVTRVSGGKSACLFVDFVIVVWVALSKCASVACPIYSFSIYMIVS